MKNLLSTLYLLLLSSLLYAQDFAPVGATWYYGTATAFSPNIDFIKWESVKDTVIQGKACREIRKNSTLTCRGEPSVEFMYDRNDTVFRYDTAFKSFHVLYNFNVQALDHWEFPIVDEGGDVDTIVVSVNTVNTRIINGVSLREIHTTVVKKDDVPTQPTGEVFLEKIGSESYPIYWDRLHESACDGNYTQGLRCYNEQEFSFEKLQNVDSCNHRDLVAIEKYNLSPLFSVSPNPTNGQFTIDTKLRDYQVKLIDLSGRVLFRSSNNFGISYFNANGLPDGIYLLEVDSERVKKTV